MILGQTTLTLTRFSQARSTTTGRTAKTTASTTTFAGSVQPLTDAQRQILPEGERQRVDLRLYTTTEIRTANQHTGAPADQITYNGVKFDVVRVAYWYALLTHYEADLVRVAEAD